MRVVVQLDAEHGGEQGAALWAGVRGLVLGWCLWLLGSWGVTLAVATTVPAARWMVYASMAGMLLIWPALRLSQGVWPRVAGGLPWRRRVLLAAVGDWLSLNLVFQAVIWPLQLIAGWSFTQTLWLDLGIAAWSALVSAVIAWGRQARSAHGRTLAMLLCVGLLLAEPAMLAAGGLEAMRGVAGIGPIVPIWRLTGPGEAFASAAVAPLIGSVAAAAVAGWLVLWAAGGLRRSENPG